MEVEEWLNNNELSLTIWNNKYRLNNESFEDWLKRVSGNNSNVAKLILDKKFIFGGRTLANRGKVDGSYSNCYSIGYVPDSLEGILDVNSKIALTFKAQGGQGLSLSHIRPKGSMIKGLYESDGIVPFMEMFNTTTASISQGGSRKGALMMSIDIWHKEADTFITIKSNMDKINKANLSVEIDNEFMEVVEASLNDGIDYVVTKTTDFGDYDVCPIKLFRLVCDSARKSAEPGIIFVDDFRNYNIMQYCDDYKIETCNPCGEQPLPKHGACNLSSINLSEYVIDPYTNNAKIDYISLSKDISIIVEAMDDVLEENLDRHALPEQRAMAENYRNIGIGIMGIADMFVKLGLIYGDAESIAIAEYVMKFIFRESVISSSNLALTRGSFPMYSSNVWDSDIIKNAFSKEEINLLKTSNRLRNCSLLSIAPTGSIGTMFNVSTGVEPFFALSYIRKTESLNKEGDTYYNIYIGEADSYMKKFNTDKLPKCFVASKDIPWKQRVLMQGALQKYTDTAISSTINLPEDTTTEDIMNIYIESWRNHLKGVTVYVDGSRAPILSESVPGERHNRQAPIRPKSIEADYHQIKIKGEQFIVLVGLLNNIPYEIFTFRPNINVDFPKHKGIITKHGKMHYGFDSEYINIENIQLANTNIEENAATLYTSMLLRHGAKLEYIIKTAKKVNNNISSFSSAMCRILSKYIESKEVKGEVCPECGSKIINEAGCVHCTNCGWSKCG